MATTASRRAGNGGNGPTLIYEDNQGAISMAKNPVFHKRTKHIQPMSGIGVYLITARPTLSFLGVISTLSDLLGRL